MQLLLRDVEVHMMVISSGENEGPKKKKIINKGGLGRHTSVFQRSHKEVGRS
jgi:hypothetical protein